MVVEVQYNRVCLPSKNRVFTFLFCFWTSETKAIRTIVGCRNDIFYLIPVGSIDSWKVVLPEDPLIDSRW